MEIPIFHGNPMEIPIFPENPMENPILPWVKNPPEPLSSPDMPNSPQPHHPRLGRSAPRRWSWARRRSYPAESGVFAMKNGEELSHESDKPWLVTISRDLYSEDLRGIMITIES